LGSRFPQLTAFLLAACRLERFLDKCFVSKKICFNCFPVFYCKVRCNHLACTEMQKRFFVAGALPTGVSDAAMIVDARSSGRLLLLVLPLICCSLLAGAAPAYTVTDLGILPGGVANYAFGINQSGHVVGWTDFNGSIAGFLWIGGTMQNIGASFNAYSVNDRDAVVGTINGLAVMWRSGRTIPLNPQGGAATAINDVEQIAGYSRNSNGSDQAALFQPRLQFLITPMGVSSYAYGINRSNQVVGEVRTTTSSTATLWQNGTAITLGMLPGDTSSIAHSINDHGAAVGYSAAAGSNAPAQAVIWANGTIQGLGTIQGWNQSFGIGINNLGQVVGQLGVGTGPDTTHAFLYTQGVMYDLNSLITASDEWTLWWATAINDSGQIIALGSHNGQTRAALLNPQSASISPRP
jgi:probable HAF family extracellular repeat protein